MRKVNSFRVVSFVSAALLPFAAGCNMSYELFPDGQTIPARNVFRSEPVKEKYSSTRPVEEVQYDSKDVSRMRGIGEER